MGRSRTERSRARPRRVQQGPFSLTEYLARFGRRCSSSLRLSVQAHVYIPERLRPVSTTNSQWPLYGTVEFALAASTSAGSALSIAIRTLITTLSGLELNGLFFLCSGDSIVPMRFVQLVQGNFARCRLSQPGLRSFRSAPI